MNANTNWLDWIPVAEKKPEHGQHVLVWDTRNNVYPFPADTKGDDGNRRVHMGDAIFWSGEYMWKMMSLPERMKWNDDPKEYIKCGNKWDRWNGQGPCTFDKVTHWIPLPQRNPTTSKDTTHYNERVSKMIDDSFTYILSVTDKKTKLKREIKINRSLINDLCELQGIDIFEELCHSLNLIRDIEQHKFSSRG